MKNVLVSLLQGRRLGRCVSVLFVYWVFLTVAALTASAQSCSLPQNSTSSCDCEATDNPGICNRCWTGANVLAMGCALSGTCGMDYVYQVLNQCLGSMPPEPPAPVTPVEQSLACGGEGFASRPSRASLHAGLLRPVKPAYYSSCSIAFLDPVKLENSGDSLMLGNGVTGSPSVLGSKGRQVQAIAADSAARVVVRIPANYVGEHLQITVLDEYQRSGLPSQHVGWLNSINGSEGSEKTGSLTVVAKSAGGTPMAFAVYHAPADFSRGPAVPSDDTSSSRAVYLQVNSLNRPDFSLNAGLMILRPPVVLVNGLWGGANDWDAVLKPAPEAGYSFAPFVVQQVKWARKVAIVSSTPAYSQGTLQKFANTNALGLSHNAPEVLNVIKKIVTTFRAGGNPRGIPAAASQVDAIGHSMGGLLVRTVEALAEYAGPLSFGAGNVHKLITIGTPHLGSPLAVQLLFPSNDCLRKLLAWQGNLAFRSATLKENSPPISGAIADLQGDDVFGVPMSSALADILSPVNPHEAPTALIAAKIESANIAGLDYRVPARFVRGLCLLSASPLAQSLTASGWPGVFQGSDSDAVVSIPSQLAGLSNPSFMTFGGVIHSSGLEGLSFMGPAELDGASRIPEFLVGVLNAPLDPAPADPRAGTIPFHAISRPK